MSLKMNIEAAVHIDQIMLKQLQKIGWVQYRVSMYYEAKHFKSKIYMMASNIAFQHKNDPDWIEPSIGNDSYHSYSSKLRMQYMNEPVKDNVTYYFKGYIDLTLLDKIKLFIQVDLLFSQGYVQKFEPIQSFTGTIKKTHSILTYLPITFDQFGVLQLSGLYHAALMEFKFQTSEDDAQYLQSEYKNMQSYLQNLTNGFRLAQINDFYKYYRETLQNQFTILQNRQIELGKIKDKQFHCIKFIKLNKNKKIEALLNQLYYQSIEKATNSQKQQLIQLILQDILSIKALIYKVWNDTNSMIRVYSFDITQSFKQTYEYQLKERFKANIFSHRIKNHDWTFSKYNNTSKSHQQQAELVRNKSEAENQIWQSTFLIEGKEQFQDETKSLKIFEQIYETGNIQSSENVSNDFQHVIVLVHGFQAHRNDFTALKQCLEARHKLKVYISASNIGKTEESIDSCGKRLAIQVTRMTSIIKNKFKISFIGHSMGGIIIRSALRFLSQMKDIFYAYISICSPHLGYLYSTTTLVHAGLWLINTLQKCDSILQLCMQDNKNLRQCLLYKLAEGGLLNPFSKIAFIASSQDEYVAYESARVQKNAVILTEELNNKGQSEVICQMVDNILCEVQASEVSRLDVVFCIQGNTLDTFLGRTGHIKFLSDPHFIKQFAISLDHLFL